jgi:hypothetical protein
MNYFPLISGIFQTNKQVSQGLKHGMYLLPLEISPKCNLDQKFQMMQCGRVVGESRMQPSLSLTGLLANEGINIQYVRSPSSPRKKEKK